MSDLPGLIIAHQAPDTPAPPALPAPAPAHGGTDQVALAAAPPAERDAEPAGGRRRGPSRMFFLSYSLHVM